LTKEASPHAFALRSRPDRRGHRRLWTLYGTQADRQTEMFSPAPTPEGAAPGPKQGEKRRQAQWGTALRAGLLAEVQAFCKVNDRIEIDIAWRYIDPYRTTVSALACRACRVGRL
jgi:hypothetical protein